MIKNYEAAAVQYVLQKLYCQQLFLRSTVWKYFGCNHRKELIFGCTSPSKSSHLSSGNRSLDDHMSALLAVVVHLTSTQDRHSLLGDLLSLTLDVWVFGCWVVVFEKRQSGNAISCKNDIAERKNFWLNHETFMQIASVNWQKIKLFKTRIQGWQVPQQATGIWAYMQIIVFGKWCIKVHRATEIR